MSKIQQLKEVIQLIEECIAQNKIEFLAKLIITLQENYNDVATLSTDGNYNEQWTHRQVLDYLTYESKA
jgi:hypothetical protein